MESKWSFKKKQDKKNYQKKHGKRDINFAQLAAVEGEPIASLKKSKTPPSPSILDII